MKKERLTIYEVAELLPFWSVGTIRNYAHQGKVPVTKVAGRLYFDRAEIEEFSKRIIVKREGNYGKKSV